MKKNRDWNSHIWLFKKLLRSMKLTSFLILGFVISAEASSYSRSTKNLKEGALIEQEVTQQQKSVSGKVTDTSGGELPGVSVVLKGTTIGTISDNNGNYSLVNLSPNAILQFSFVGMKTQEIVVGNKTTINVTLAEEAVGLEEVVAIGYGTKSKATITGAVETVTDAQLSGKPQSNVTQSLQGAVPGLMVTRGSGRVGEGNGLQIRGVSSRAGTGVLVIIDGIPQPENDSRALDLLNPQDIESISILKDAQASIYGSRAAGGVLLVTTKNGKSNKPVIIYSANFAVNVPSIWPKRANIFDQADYYLRAFANDGVTQNPYTYLKDLLPTLDRNKPQVIKAPFSDVPKMSSGYYDWMDIMFDPAFQQTPPAIGFREI
ncbi:MAG: TonB-dependent receptor plug domain-containing protein [Bacteroidota bacterium]|nr:TonB-dependent receptor plug domain-containing protein [Bacteroidota bacterium]